MENYFYPADSDGLGRFFLAVRDALDFDEHEGLHRTREHTLSLVKQMTDQYGGSHIRVRFTRLSGYAVRLIVDILNLGHDDLADWITKIEGPNGQGGIENPWFPQGEELEVALSRLISIVISDCHLKDNGSIEYYEPEMERIRIVEKDLQVFGDVVLDPTKAKGKAVYNTCFPGVLGKALLSLGLTPGNKTILNPVLPEFIMDFSYNAKCAFFEELIPQDGTIDGTHVTWCHSNAIRTGDKEDKYDFDPLIGEEVVGFIKEHGKPAKKYWRLSLGALHRLMSSKNKAEAEMAWKLHRVIYENANSFVQREILLAEDIGVLVEPVPYSVFYHRKTERVTVSWSGVLSEDNDIRLLIIAPPNDIKKREIARKWLLNNLKSVNEIVDELTRRGIRINQWWFDL